MTATLLLPSLAPLVQRPRPVAVTILAVPPRQSDLPAPASVPVEKAGLPDDMRCWLQSHCTPRNTEAGAGGFGN